jgi:peptidyl-prolyl cis-trans isomerase SDCCAG10
MGETSELNNKHTLFGKVVGPTLYNMIKLQDGILEDDRPVHPHKILRTKILINPFPDIEPRKLIKVCPFLTRETFSC